MKIDNFKSALTLTSLFTLLLWLIQWAASSGLIHIENWSIHPGDRLGFIGVFSAPLMHTSWAHIAANSAPLIVLGTALIYGYSNSRWYALAFIWLFGGLGVWLFARPNFHLGASGLTHGLLFYLFTIGVLRRDKRSVALLMIAFMMYGGMLISIFPADPKISWESHLYSAISGVIAAFLFQRLDPVPVRKRYSWEEESDTIVQCWEPAKDHPSTHCSTLNHHNFRRR